MEIKNTASTGDLLCTSNGDFRQESRSYTCTFCKRDFSNAQALGGHMNVHRKDRARLQESIQETLITNEPTKGTTNSIDQGEEQSLSDGVPKRPLTLREDNSSRKNDDGVNFKKPTLQLSLCIESSSSSTISDSSMIRSNKVSALSSSSTEVDLELRLGMD